MSSCDVFEAKIVLTGPDRQFVMTSCKTMTSTSKSRKHRIGYSFSLGDYTYPVAYLDE